MTPDSNDTIASPPLDAEAASATPALAPSLSAALPQSAEPSVPPSSTDLRQPPAAAPIPPSPPRRESTVAGTMDAIKPMVAEIRQRLAAIASHEIAVQRREAELEQQYRLLEQQAREVANNELEQLRRRIEARSNELDAQTVELAARRARLERQDAQLAGREAEQQRAQQELERGTARLNERIESERQKRLIESQSIRGRIAVIRRREVELERRIQLARDEIVRQRGDVEERLDGLQLRSNEIEERRAQVESRAAEWNEQVAALETRAAQIESQRLSLAAERRKLDEQTRQLRGSAKQLEQQRDALAERQKELDQHWQTTREQRAKLIKQIDELGTKQRAFQAEQLAAEERTRRAELRENQLREQAAVLEAEAARIEGAEADLAARQAEIDRLYELAGATERDALRQRDEALSLRDQVETRDAETRQAALALELERQHVALEAARIERSHAELEGLRDQRDQEFKQLRAELEQRSTQLAVVQSGLLAAPRRWWLRSTALAAAAAGLAAIGWWRWDAPRFMTASEIRIVSESADPTDKPQRVAARHAAELLSLCANGTAPNEPAAEAVTPIARGNSTGVVLAADAEPIRESRQTAAPVSPDSAAEEALRAAWRSAAKLGRIDVNPGVLGGSMTPSGAPVIEVCLTASGTESGAELVRQISESYVRRVNASPPLAQHPLATADLIERRAAAADEAVRLQRALTENEEILAAEPDFAARGELLSAVDSLRAEQQGLRSSLDAARAELKSLQAGTAPRGAVGPDELEAALAKDDVHLEDLKEFRAAARQYQTELAVAMVLMVDPLKDLRGSLADFANVIAEQRKQEAPPAVALLLEELAARVEAFQSELAEFTGRWDDWRRDVERANANRSAPLTEDDVVALVQQQTRAADGARKLAGDAAALLSDTRAQLDAFAGSIAGGTREVVVAAMLRSELARWADDVAALTPAAGTTDTAGNFQLDSHDRKLRGLSTRLAQRRALIGEQLQNQSDSNQRDRHATRIDALRTMVARLEDRRDELPVLLADAVEKLRALDEHAAQQAAQRAALESTIAAQKAELGRLQQQVRSLDAAAIDAGRSRSIPDRAEVGPQRSDQVGGVNRGRNTALAAMGAFAAVFLACMLMVVRSPLAPPRTAPAPITRPA